MINSASFHRRLAQELNLDLPLKLKSVSGGDINAAYQVVDAQHRTLFLKCNSRQRYPEMLAKEARALQFLRETHTFRIPEVYGVLEHEGEDILVLEFIASQSPQSDFHHQFGQKLAQLHQQGQPYFGWEEDNYIGSLVQRNEAKSTWSDFYGSQRIEPLNRLAFDRGLLAAADLRASERILVRLENWLPDESPSLLHGDLWSGNYLCDEENQAVLIDPAIYCGHREMDLAMMRLFGGFSEAVFQAYQEQHPTEKGLNERLPLHQWYPLLVHLNLFGASYYPSVREILQRFS